MISDDARRKLISRISMVDLLNLLFFIFLIIIFILSFARTPYRFVLPAVYLLIGATIIAMIFARTRIKSEKHRNILMFIYPVIILFAYFESFFMLLPFFNSSRFDTYLERIDNWLTGVSPTLWMELWSSPLLTEILYLCYVFYFPMPLIVLGIMLKRKEIYNIERALIIFLICYYMAYVTYFFIPAEGPRFFLKDMYAGELKGLYFAAPIRQIINTLEPNKLDVFPSLHMAILVITMYAAFINTRNLFYVFLPVAAGISVSLIYCRYHYVVDAVAGSIFAFAAIVSGTYIHKKWQGYFIPHFGKNRS